MICRCREVKDRAGGKRQMEKRRKERRWEQRQIHHAHVKGVNGERKKKEKFRVELSGGRLKECVKEEEMRRCLFSVWHDSSEF